MKSLTSMFLALITLLAAGISEAAFSDSVDSPIEFATATGGTVEIDMRAGTLRTPRGRHTRLRGCSNDFQTCFTDNHGFAFSFFKKCNEAGLESYRRLRFTPQIVTALHEELWMVFDASPRYMFHYVIPKGIVGIYVGPTPSFDFRSVLRDRNFRVASLESMQYLITGSGTIAACSK